MKISYELDHRMLPVEVTHDLYFINDLGVVVEP